MLCEVETDHVRVIEENGLCSVSRINCVLKSLAEPGGCGLDTHVKACKLDMLVYRWILCS